jgi:two-component system sensor histidine kinase KdpD
MTTARGHLRIYLGAAPGVGKTYAMLSEAKRRQARGTDVVVGFVETHGRTHTAELMDGLDVVPRKVVQDCDMSLTEMDLAAILARKPEVALVDELAHTNVPNSGRNAKRWQDIEHLLDAGIDVISTVNIQHLESISDVVQKITGVPERETLPDMIVRRADQIELIDMAPEALRRRMAHGNIYSADKVDAALSNYFRPGNLAALRELALLWLADRVDAGLQAYRQQHDIVGTWEARERVVVGLTGGSEGDTLIRRAARIAARSSGELLAVHVSQSDGLTAADPRRLRQQRELAEDLGGSYHQIIGDNVPDALLSFARAENATQLVLGGSRRSRPLGMLSGLGIGATAIRDSGDIDVHIVMHPQVGKGRGLPRRRGALSIRRRLQGFALAVTLPLVITLALMDLHDAFNLTIEVLAFLLSVIVVALVGGLWPAILAAIAASILLTYYFTPPRHTFTIGETNTALALAAFVLVAVLVSSVVDRAARRTRQAARASAEAETLATLAGTILRGEAGLPALLERVRESFGMTSSALLEREGSGWQQIGCAGPATCRRPQDGDVAVPARDDLVLVLQGRNLAADEHRLVGAFADHAAALVDRGRLTEAAAEVKPLAEADRLRTALLRAVGHDLRTPLAAAKAAVTSLRSSDIEWTAEERDELLGTADEAIDRLGRLVDNLLDLSRLQAGVLPLFLRPTSLDEVVPAVLRELGQNGSRVLIDIAHTLPLVQADPALLERVIVNLVGNAIRHSSSESPPILTASTFADQVQIRVVDRGPGIPGEHRDRAFIPFQRLGDTDNTTGVGLGLALARGLTEAMGGALEPEDTPGGGLTMVVSLAAAPSQTAKLVPGTRERRSNDQEHASD